MGAMDRHRVFAVALAFASVLSTAFADLASTYPMSELLDWERESQMQMSISGADGDVVPFIYSVVPLTGSDLGLNDTQRDGGRINIEGRLIIADASNYGSISGSDVIPYLCCDGMNNSFIQPDEILNNLMSNNPQPAAIVLYSQLAQCCGLAGQNLNYQKILTMPDQSAAAQLANITSSSAGTARAQISGNFTTTDQDQGQQTGNNSAVAMSILYSITGLITLLFLIIIATGAIRAHRYPERYGPRSGFGGRPRQSRAKGLARAVLETLPIVKFGDSHPAKPDPNVELENAPAEPTNTTNAARDASHNNSQRHLSTIPESPTEARADPEAAGALRTSHDQSITSAGEENSRASGADGPNGPNAVPGRDEGLGCSICTEDFTVGEDVRVLPCNHKFHPQCVDPWLVNVSGTCPLCRLDLRPEQEASEEVGDGNADAPPLDADANEAGDSSNSTRRRSRFFDLARLRHAPVEERIEVLRRFRSEQRQGSSGSNEEESRGRSKLSDRLRDRFHIRTRAAQQSSGQTRSLTSGQPTHTT